VISKYGIKTTRRLAYLSGTGKRLSMTRRLFQWRTLYYFDQQSKGKKGTIVAMIAGTKAQAVIAISKKKATIRNTDF
jgi:hypothetical protein